MECSGNAIFSTRVKAAKLAARKRELREIGCEAMLARDRADHAEREVLDGNKAI